MDRKRISTVGTMALTVLWLCLAVFAWFGPEKALSETERRQLAGFPEVSVKAVVSGQFMSQFEEYTMDQFPVRDGFRRLKSLFHYYVLGQGDNNGIYLADGSAAQMEYPLNQSSLEHALERFSGLCEAYFQDSRVYTCVVPDKGYYLAEKKGVPTMDYEALFSAVREGMPDATYIDITDTLDASCYYRTDTHWRQEQLIPAATRLARAMGVTAPDAANYTPQKLDRPFYGVYYGQAALPMEPDELVLLNSPLLEGCTVTNHETGKTGKIYDLEKETARDLYEVFLSGPVSLLTIDNPAADSDRELIVFRDSFGSAMVPLLLGSYRTVTMVDIRYLPASSLERFLDFHGQDVLFLYSTLVLNNSETIP